MHITTGLTVQHRKPRLVTYSDTQTRISVVVGVVAQYRAMSLPLVVTGSLRMEQPNDLASGHFSNTTIMLGKGIIPFAPLITRYKVQLRPTEFYIRNESIGLA